MHALTVTVKFMSSMMISSGLQLGGLPWSENKVGQMGKVKTENWKHWKCVCVHCETCHVMYKWTYLAGKLLGHTRNEYQLKYTCGGLHKAPKTTIWVVAYSPPPPPIIPKSIKSNLGLYTVVEVPMLGLKITIIGQVRIRVQSETNALAGKWQSIDCQSNLDFCLFIRARKAACP